MQGPESAKCICRDCRRYDREKMFCKKDQRTCHPLSKNPGCFEMNLADHYVENPWSEWKKQAEREALREKVK